MFSFRGPSRFRVSLADIGYWLSKSGCKRFRAGTIGFSWVWTHTFLSGLQACGLAGTALPGYQTCSQKPLFGGCRSTKKTVFPVGDAMLVGYRNKEPYQSLALSGIWCHNGIWLYWEYGTTTLCGFARNMVP